SDIVSAEIDRVARDYSRKAKIPGFRPGKAPARVIKQRFKDQILTDVAHDLIPRAIDDAMRERGVEPVDTPDVRDVVVEEGQALTFTASFDTLPSFDPGDYATLSLKRPSVHVDEADVERARARRVTRRSKDAASSMATRWSSISNVIRCRLSQRERLIRSTRRGPIRTRTSASRWAPKRIRLGSMSSFLGSTSARRSVSRFTT